MKPAIGKLTLFGKHKKLLKLGCTYKKIRVFEQLPSRRSLITLTCDNY